MRALRSACRSLARRPAFAVAAILILGLSVAITVAMFSLVDTVLLKPLPYPDAGQLVTVMEANLASGQPVSLVAPGRLEEWNRENSTFDAISGSYAESVTDTSASEPARLAGRRVAPRYFAVFRTPALVGRTFTADEERFGGPQAAVISEGFWTRRYGRTPDVLNRALIVGGVKYSIVGVMPAAFAPGAIDVWLPAQTPPGLLRVRQARFLSGVGRIRAGISLKTAAANLRQVQEAMGQRYPATDKGWSVQVVSLRDARVGSYREGLWVVFGAVALLLAIAEMYGPSVVGRRFTFDQIPGEHEIVGVVGNVIEDGARAHAAPYVYACQTAGEWPDPDYVVLAAGDLRRTIASIREVVHRLAPTRALFGVRPLDEVLAASLDQPRWNAGAVSLFAGAAIVLASIGLYGLLTLLVVENAHEVGVRIALGARRGDIAGLVFRRAARLTAAGIAAGLLLVWATTRLLAASLFSVGSLDPPTIVVAVLLFAGVTVAAAAGPLRRALTTDPIVSVRKT